MKLPERDNDRDQLKKYRKRPIVIEAVRFNGDYDQAKMICAWSGGCITAENGDGTLTVGTLEGAMTAQPGDFIIKGVKGEFYPCKPDIFEASYEAERT